MGAGECEMDTDRRTVLRATAGVAAAGALPGLLQDDGPIRIGSDIPYKPFEYRTTDGTLTGFDVDIAGAIFEVLGREYEFVDTGFDTIIPSLNNGNFRIIMSAMTINDQRDQEVDFSDPYFVAYQTVAVLAGSDIDEVSDLKGQTVAVQKGTTGEAAAEQLKEERFDGDLTIDSYDQIPGAFSALLNGQAVAVINDNAVNLQYTEDNENIVMLEGEGAAAEQGEGAPPYLTLTVEEYGIAFRQDDDEFRQQVNEALTTVIQDGTYAEIYTEYFPGEPPASILERGQGTTTEGTGTATTTAGEGTTAGEETNTTETTTSG